MELVEVSLDKGADVNGAAAWRGHFQLYHILLERGADINAHGSTGHVGTALVSPTKRARGLGYVLSSHRAVADLLENWGGAEITGFVISQISHHAFA